MSKHQPQHMRAAQPYWHGATRRLIACGTAAMVAGALAAPTGALAAEWVDVDGDYHETAYGTEADPWMWDGKNDLTLNNYTGGTITAAGKLDVTYKGDSTISGADGDGEASGTGILVKNGKEEDAELTVKGNKGDSLTVKDVNDGISCAGNTTVKGSGKVTISADMGGIVSAKSVTIDGSTLDVDVTANKMDEVIGILSYNSVKVTNATISIKSDVTPAGSSNAWAYGIVSSASSSSSFGSGPNASVTVKDSTLDIVTRAPKSDSLMNGGSSAITAIAYGGDASITIDNSTVRASSPDVAFFAEAVGEGTYHDSTITLKNAKIVSPSDGKVAEYSMDFSGYSVSIATIANGNSDDWTENVVSDVKIEGTKKSDKDGSGENTNANVEQASYAGSASSALAATGDSAGSGLAAALGAGVIALGAGIGLRRREER